MAAAARTMDDATVDAEVLPRLNSARLREIAYLVRKACNKKLDDSEVYDLAKVFFTAQNANQVASYHYIVSELMKLGRTKHKADQLASALDFRSQ